MKATFSSFLKNTSALNIKEDIECRTFSHNKDKGPIIIKFKSEETLLEALQRNKTYFKEHGKPATYDDKNIYINRFLPKDLARAFKKGREMRSEGKLKDVWIDSKSSKLLVKTETGKTTHICTAEDLDLF